MELTRQNKIISSHNHVYLDRYREERPAVLGGILSTHGFFVGKL